MNYWLNDDSSSSRLPKVGAWVFSVSLPVILAAAIVVSIMPLGDTWKRSLSFVEQISGSRSELLPMLFSSQVGVSALVVAMAPLQPGRWCGNPQKLGKRWLGEMKRVASQENRYLMASFGLICISSAIVLGVAICVLNDVESGGALLLAVAWGLHAVSSVVLIMVPSTGVTGVDGYWRSLARLFYIAEMWPEGLKEAKKEVEGERPFLGSKVRRWRIVIALLFIMFILVAAASLEKCCFGAHVGVRGQFVSGALVAIAILASIGAGYCRWRIGIISSILLFFLSVPPVLARGFLVEVESIAVTTSSSSWRNIGFAFAVTVELFLFVLLLMVALGFRLVWGRFDCFESILVSAWVYELKLQCRYGHKCSAGERKEVEKFFVKLAKRKKKGLAKTVKKSALLPFVAR